MKIELLENKIIEYFEGELSQEEVAGLHRVLANSKEAKAIYEEFELVYQDLDQKEVFIPSHTLRDNFNVSLHKAIIKEEKNKPSNDTSSSKTWFLYGLIGVLLLALGLFMGMNLNKGEAIDNYENNMMAMRSEMMHLLNENSTSTRIKAVNMVHEMETPDEDVVNALVHTMNEDRSSNVRLAAVNALGRYTTNEKIKSSLIQALEDEGDPSIQITLISILTRFNDKEAVKGFDKLIEDESTLKFVKDEAYFGKLKLETY